MRIFVLLVLVLVIACERKKQPATDHSADTASVSVPAIGNSNPITIDEMIGVWQESPEIGSGYLDHYQFMPDSSFRFVYNEMICDKRTIGYSGTWKIVGDKLKITISRSRLLLAVSLFLLTVPVPVRLIITLKEAKKGISVSRIFRPSHFRTLRLTAQSMILSVPHSMEKDFGG